MHDEHGHEDHDHGSEEVVTHAEEPVVEPVVGHEDHAGHAHEGETLLDTIIEITFGIEHMAAEFFWNVVFLLVGFAVSKAIALRKIHKYIDEKHGVSHEEGY
jgi:hypothetical protein